jgi:hypothetical protein
MVTTRVRFVSAVQVGSSHPLEQPLTPDDHSSQRTEEEPIPNAEDFERLQDRLLRTFRKADWLEADERRSSPLTFR